jgi:hypothetical protein
MGKSTKPGAAKYFNDNTAAAYKSAANAMKQFRASIPRTPIKKK